VNYGCNTDGGDGDQKTRGFGVHGLI